MKTPQETHPDNQDGMALLLVLAVLAATTILAAHMMLVSETIAKDAKVAAITSELRLQAESAADMGLWMHLTDRRLFSDRTLGVDLSDREATSDFEPWMMDRREHLLFDDTCQVFIGDAIKSISVTNIDSIKSGIDVDDSDALDVANEFIDIYNDYVDSNDLTNLYGKEAEDYANDGYPTLPRNDTMQFRAEIYWLENWQNVITGEITIIPPPGITISTGSSSSAGGSSGRTPSTGSSSSSSGKIPFFTASEQDFINQITDLSDANLQAILDARDAWTFDAVPLEESLDADLLYNIRSKFSFDESNYAEITATATDPSGEIRVVRTVTREVNMSSNSIFADRSQETFSIWEIRNE
ncbi:MAG: hypothetical protein J6T46_12180 [Victivallales bacterium]|nr:hypothetical protein [Victivallales bacterium]